MQHQYFAESPQQRDAVLANTFVQRLFHWNEPTPLKTPVREDQFDAVDLDQRVRESGEW